MVDHPHQLVVVQKAEVLSLFSKNKTNLFSTTINTMMSKYSETYVVPMEVV